MSTSQIYIAGSIAVLAIVAVLLFFVKRDRKENRLTPLASFAFGCVLVGLVFSEERIFSYGLMGVGVILAVVDMFNRSRNK